jgi:1,4-dihydroxy-6-naphthoate synthase
MKIYIGHGNDPINESKLYAIKNNKIDFPFEYQEFFGDLDTLNKLAIAGKLDVTEFSTHAIPFLKERYYILNSLAPVRKGFWPPLVGKSKEFKYVAVPGSFTTATLLIKLAFPEAKLIDLPYQKIIEAVSMGIVDAGVLVHDSQVLFEKYNLKKIMDMGEWWYEQTGLPIPAGVYIAKSSLGKENILKISEKAKKSAEYAIANKNEIIDNMMRFKNILEENEIIKLVETCIFKNSYLVDLGSEGRNAILTLLEMAQEKKLVPEFSLDFI